MEWRAIYVPELDNVRAALDWALDAGGDRAIAVGLAGDSGSMWMTLSLYGEVCASRLRWLVCVGSDTWSRKRHCWLSLGVRLGEAARRGRWPSERAIVFIARG